jgi:hypothetical protein
MKTKPCKDIQLPYKPDHVLSAKNVKNVLLDWARESKLIDDKPVACRLTNKGALEIFKIDDEPKKQFSKEYFLPVV